MARANSEEYSADSCVSRSASIDSQTSSDDDHRVTEVTANLITSERSNANTNRHKTVDYTETDLADETCIRCLSGAVQSISKDERDYPLSCDGCSKWHRNSKCPIFRCTKCACYTCHECITNKDKHQHLAPTATTSKKNRRRGPRSFTSCSTTTSSLRVHHANATTAKTSGSGSKRRTETNARLPPRKRQKQMASAFMVELQRTCVMVNGEQIQAMQTENEQMRQRLNLAQQEREELQATHKEQLNKKEEEIVALRAAARENKTEIEQLKSEVERLKDPKVAWEYVGKCFRDT